MQIKNVPNGWKIKKLKQVLSLLKDGTHGTHKDCAQGKFLLSAKDVVDGRVLCSEDSRIISDEDFNSIHAKYKLQNKDIVLTIVGTVGRSAIINDYNQEYTFQRSVAILRPNESILSEFLYDQIQSNNFQNELKKRQSVSAQPGVYLEDLGNLPCVVPPKEEQKKIAEILGTWDRAIEELTGLIAEKKELKRGLMQQLLTGAKRLPDFTKPWSHIQLKQLGECIRGVSYKPTDLKDKDAEDTVRLLRSSNIQNNKLILWFKNHKFFSKEILLYVWPMAVKNWLERPPNMISKIVIDIPLVLFVRFLDLETG